MRVHIGADDSHINRGIQCARDHKDLPRVYDQLWQYFDRNSISFTWLYSQHCLWDDNNWISSTSGGNLCPHVFCTMVHHDIAVNIRLSPHPYHWIPYTKNQNPAMVDAWPEDISNLNTEECPIMITCIEVPSVHMQQIFGLGFLKPIFMTLTDFNDAVINFSIVPSWPFNPNVHH